ncbi:hypothetical protein A0H76_2135 [Hepatospora eriocheir]|uniref:Uncharacterized protein n=1 Tax=Hepatospora eriocheir TaxID=1081669 RepID=A0A1X0QFW3_9MICR|nr:hypothetical protein A0H76_2135 [Hepatospora eriocheir]
MNKFLNKYFTKIKIKNNKKIFILQALKHISYILLIIKYELTKYNLKKIKYNFNKKFKRL